jgi:TP901 family phage tail tape measure protein
MAESLRDYFIKFAFKTDVTGAKVAQNQLDNFKRGFDDLGKKAFVFNEMFDAVNRLFAPFKGLADLVNATAQEADELGDLSERTGIATEALEEYAYMAKLAGTEMGAMTTGMRILEKQMGEAASGSKEARETFSKLGVGIRGANGQLRTTEEMLPELSRAFQKLPDHATKTAYAMKLFGRSGQELLPLLEKGPEEIEFMRRELALLGGVTSEEFVKAGSDYADNLTRVAAAWKGVRQAISGPLVKMFNDTVGVLLKWWKVNGDLVRSKITEWFFQFGSSLQALFDTAVKLAAPFLLLAAALNVPLLVMIGMKLLIALLIDDFANWMAGNDSLIGRAIKNWDEWINKIAETHPVLAALLDGFGRTVKHMSTLVEGLFNMFNVLIDSFLEGGWDGFMKELGTTFDVAIEGWIEAFKGFFSWIGDGIRSIPGLSAVLGQGDGTSMEQVFAAKQRREAFERSISGSASSPSSIANSISSSGGNVNAQASIVVNVPEGQDPRKTAEEIGKMWDEKFDSEMRAGFNALVPDAY